MLLELFDQHGVSFISVTQQFNTTTSMGRLMANVLLSFALSLPRTQIRAYRWVAPGSVARLYLRPARIGRACRGHPSQAQGGCALGRLEEGLMALARQDGGAPSTEKCRQAARKPAWPCHRRMISAVPQPSAVARITWRAKHASAVRCGRPIASSRWRLSSVTLTTIRALIPRA
jgi:hypothetical protein